MPVKDSGMSSTSIRRPLQKLAIRIWIHHPFTIIRTFGYGSK
jgi:hypothetical protein